MWFITGHHDGIEHDELWLIAHLYHGNMGIAIIAITAG
jgi:hypothetical protein